jgi:type IV pilus biogenesis protein CpaD/CtpE
MKINTPIAVIIAGLFIGLLSGCVTNDSHSNSEKKYSCPHKGWN